MVGQRAEPLERVIKWVGKGPWSLKLYYIFI